MNSQNKLNYSTQPDFLSNDDTKITPFPWIADTSMKAGEILRNDKGQYSFLCFHCGLSFQDFGETINHIDIHYNTSDVKWDVDFNPPAIEPVQFILCAEVEPDLKSNHQSNIPDFSTTTGTTVKYDPVINAPQHCPVCELWCDDFRAHIKTAHDFNDRIYQCFICGSFFKSFITLKNHISCKNHTKSKCYHCEMEPPVMRPSDPRRHKCLFCKQWYANHIEFKIHFKDAHNKDADYFFHKRSNCNIFTCYICEREFPLRYNLASHMKTHHDKFLSHQCPTCGRRFRTFGQLTQHLKTHEGKTFKCEQCDKEFPFYERLRIHLQCHKTELNYKCNVCNKAFKIRKYLTRHMAAHDDNKKYACRFCDARFNFTSGRRAHEKNQHKAL